MTREEVEALERDVSARDLLDRSQAAEYVAALKESIAQRPTVKEETSHE